MGLGISARTLDKVRAESERAIAKHGVERSALSPTEPDLAKLAILGEEYGEVCRALTYDNDEGLEHLMEELIQVSSVAACWAQALELRLTRMPADNHVVVISET